MVEQIELRDRQKEFVANSLQSLIKYGNTLRVSPTGSGKTIMLSSVISELNKQIPDFKACVLAHRKEIVEQNADKLTRVDSSLTKSIIDAGQKDWSGQVTFAMIQTLKNKRQLKVNDRLGCVLRRYKYLHVHFNVKCFCKTIKRLYRGYLGIFLSRVGIFEGKCKNAE